MTAGWADGAAVSWERTSAACDECATVYDGHQCPNCGQLPDADPVTVFGYVVERDDGPWLVTVHRDERAGDYGWSDTQRPISREQAQWLAR